jgi:DNA polymerase-3 subunit epsilon
VKSWRPWTKGELNPALVANHASFKRFDQDRPIETYDFVSLDTELTGLDQRRDAIVSIGAVRIHGLHIIAGANFFSYVKPKRSLPKVSTMIHRITPDQLENAPELRLVLPALIDFIGDALIVGHYIGLDMGFINRASDKLLNGRLLNPCVDSMKLAQAYDERQQAGYYHGIGLAESYNLRALSEKYGLPKFDQHDALADAFQAAFLFLFLVIRLRTLGCNTLGDFRLASGPLGYW